MTVFDLKKMATSVRSGSASIAKFYRQLRSCTSYLVGPYACAALALSAGSIAAEPSSDVSLLFTDGSLTIEGRLISVTEDYYLIQTPLGDLRVALDKATCKGAACPTVEVTTADVLIGGADVIAEGLMPLLIGGYASTRSAESTVNIEAVGNFIASLVGDEGFGDPIGTYRVTSNSTELAFEGLLSNNLQLALASRRITPKEARALRDAGAGRMVDPSQEHIVAIDSLVTIVNRSNPITELSIEQLAEIYSGKLTNWSELGGTDLPIEVVRRNSSSGASQVFNTTVFGVPEQAAGSTAIVAEDNVEAANFVANNPGAIAYVGHAFKRGQKPLSLVSECGIGTIPDVFSVKTEEYAMFRRLYMYTRSDTDNDYAGEFVDFVKSDNATFAIQQAGFIDLGIERVEQGGESPRAMRLKNSSADPFELTFVNSMLDKIANYDRLSSTFRFRTGSAKLDRRAELDLERLAQYIAENPGTTEITLVGFADNVGPFEPNIDLSKKRAHQVAKRLAEIGGEALEGISINAIGFGEIAPVACNTSEAGRQINRRVETWIKND